VTLNTSLYAVVYYAYTSTPLYQTAHKSEVPSLTTSKDMTGGKI